MDSTGSVGDFECPLAEGVASETGVGAGGSEAEFVSERLGSAFCQRVLHEFVPKVCELGGPRQYLSQHLSSVEAQNKFLEWLWWE